MNRLFKTAFLACTVWAAGAAMHAATAHAYSAQHGVKIQINDSIVAFPDSAPFVDGNGGMQVPIRSVAEQMGYKIDWRIDGSEVQITLQNNGRTIKMKTGSKDADVNGKRVTMTSPPALFKDNHMFIPVRFISESFGYRIQWDNKNGIAIICKDGKYHAPAWHAPAPQPKTPPLSAKLIKKAKTLLGIPYVWGGTSTSGFDCSGFVNYVFRQQGLDLPRTSRQIFHTSGNRVTTSNLKPGDLVFFSIGSNSHVGIYLGNDKFISATSSHGIHIDSLASSYWGSNYIGAKRIV
ncbi:NlpC/P60 family protein [Paenibacillus solisilvae]|uniref:NlpC/P60 family protein n=1 Tax=Paenibacillus solisilvae TaxID=2486751 RepID=A0ABW0W6F1_9BACL